MPKFETQKIAVDLPFHRLLIFSLKFFFYLDPSSFHGLVIHPECSIGFQECIHPASRLFFIFFSSFLKIIILFKKRRRSWREAQFLLWCWPCEFHTTRRCRRCRRLSRESINVLQPSDIFFSLFGQWSNTQLNVERAPFSRIPLLMEHVNFHATLSCLL